MPVSLYIHIPFCLKRCVYCDFVSGIYDPGKADAYISALKKELDSVPEKQIPPAPPLLKGGISTLYIGGGTPTALSTGALSDLISHIFTRFSFTKGYEATIEANPGTLESDKLRAMLDAGMNRISIGVQSFNDAELAFLGRIHTAEEAAKAFSLAREAGFDNIGIDLIYGIPGQDIEGWKKTLERALILGPEHISTYELTVEKGTELHEYLKNPPSSPFSKGGVCSPLSQRGGWRAPLIKPHLPGEDKIIEMYEHTIDHLTSNGYEHYEISNFARPGCFSRHNLNYWDRGDYYGAGLGAHSFISGKRSCNTDSLDEYLGAVPENNSPVRYSEEITEEDAVKEAVFLGLRKTGGIDVEAFFRRYKINILSRYHNEIKYLQEAGLIETTCSACSYETSLRLTRKGLLLSNEVFMKFM